jgi:15-cis-phytoene synthase
MIPPAAPTSPEATAIWTHAHSFRVGWCLFSPAHRALVARLYAALRWIDDFVDEAPADELAGRFAQVQAWADHAAAGRDDELPSQIQTLIEDGTRLADWAEFLAGQAMDAQPQPCPDAASLTLYCQRAAGVVGLMFCDLTQVPDPAARLPASALGRAMQLTNMARDIVEDAHRHRSYLPDHTSTAVLQTQEHRRPACSLQKPNPPEPNEQPDSQQQQIETEVTAWLTQAEAWYEEGLAGLPYLPLRAALGIAVGARLYRAIGQKILRQPGLIWQGRVRTTGFEKIRLSCQAAAGLLAGRLRRFLK